MVLANDKGNFIKLVELHMISFHFNKYKSSLSVRCNVSWLRWGGIWRDGERKGRKALEEESEKKPVNQKLYTYYG